MKEELGKLGHYVFKKKKKYTRNIDSHQIFQLNPLLYPALEDKSECADTVEITLVIRTTAEPVEGNNTTSCATCAAPGC